MAGRPQLSPERLEAIELLLKDGASMREIARTLNVARESIMRHFPDYKGWSKQHNAEVSRAKRKYNSVMKSNGAAYVLE